MADYTMLFFLGFLGVMVLLQARLIIRLTNALRKSNENTQRALDHITEESNRTSSIMVSWVNSAQLLANRLADLETKMEELDDQL